MPKSFEDALIRQMDREGNPVDRQHYVADERFNRKIASAWNKVRPRRREFLNGSGGEGVSYSKEVIEQDTKTVERIKQKPEFVNERADEAVGIEYAMMEAVHEHGWLGPEAHVTPTNEYDDYVNGVDFVVSVPQESGKFLRFGIDVTVSESPEVMDKKLNRTVVQLHQQKLAPVKYFISDETGERGALEIPRFVIATSGSTAIDLEKELMEKPKEVEADITQGEMMEEIEEQARFAANELLGHLVSGYETTEDTVTVLTTAKKLHGRQVALDRYAEVLEYVVNLQKEKALTVSGGYRRASVEMISDSLSRLRKAA